MLPIINPEPDAVKVQIQPATADQESAAVPEMGASFRNASEITVAMNAGVTVNGVPPKINSDCKVEIDQLATNNNHVVMTNKAVSPNTLQPKHLLNGNAKRAIAKARSESPIYYLKPNESSQSISGMVPFIDPEISELLTFQSAASTSSLIHREDSSTPLAYPFNLNNKPEPLKHVHHTQSFYDPTCTACHAAGRRFSYVEPPGDGSGDSPCRVIEEKKETGAQILLQVFIPFMVAGFGMVAAGILLDRVKHWEVFVDVKLLFILVPSLLGLKGNLEMTLASRLSTQANLGTFDRRGDQLKLIVGNIVLTQCQATVVGFFASIAAIVMNYAAKGFDLKQSFLVCASALLTASIASLLLGIVMVVVVLISTRLHVNPDNVATPIAASLGDLTTLALLASISTGLYSVYSEIMWLAPLIAAVFLLLIPVWVTISMRNKFTVEALMTGWTPVILAMVISSCGGLILENVVGEFDGIAVFQPVINGVGGNLVGIQASRISTFLHKQVQPGRLPANHSTVCVGPLDTFFGPAGSHSRTARVLLLICVPGHLTFAFMISYIKTGTTALSATFIFVYLLVAVIQVALLLYLALVLVYFVWKRKQDPDNVTIPYLTSLGDLLGIAMLAVAFIFLDLIGDHTSAQIGLADNALAITTIAPG